MRIGLSIFFIATSHLLGAQVQLPGYLYHDPELSNALRRIVVEADLGGTYDVGEDGTETISLAVIDLSAKRPRFGGVNADNFIYPASVYKMYVAMEVLKQISEGRHGLHDMYVVRSPNDVDRSREIAFDPRPLLRDGDTVTIHYLIDLMITRSDNSAANCLIDIATRPEINATMQQYQWQGSEVTRKFLRRSLEDPGYDTIRSTETCALHAADFLYRMYTRQLVNPWVSLQLESYLGLQLDTSKLATGLPRTAMFYHKTGWWSYYTHDVGLVNDGNTRYIIALFTPVPEKDVRPRMKVLAGKVHEILSSQRR